MRIQVIWLVAIALGVVSAVSGCGSGGIGGAGYEVACKWGYSQTLPHSLADQFDRYDLNVTVKGEPADLVVLIYDPDGKLNICGEMKITADEMRMLKEGSTKQDGSCLEKKGTYTVVVRKKGSDEAVATAKIERKKGGPVSPSGRESGTAPTQQGNTPEVSRIRVQKGKTAATEKELIVDLGNGVQMEMVLIPAGEFLMGSPDSEKYAFDLEKPQHRVRITKLFYLGKYLVTQAQWEAVMGNNPSDFKGPKNPVEMVSWDDCQEFLGKLNARSGPGSGKFQLPTEAQWEYACRAGSTTRYCFGDDESKLGEYAWYLGNSGSKPNPPVGEKKPNDWGLYDMHGNVWEWCQDWYENGYDGKSPMDDPMGAATGSEHVTRGGGWVFLATYCRSAHRHGSDPGFRNPYLGLRVSLVPADK